MAEIRPFRGLCYNLAKIDQLADVIAPPYDVISPEQKKELQKKSPYNIVNLILPDGENPYESARNTLDQWIQAQILRPDPEPSIYCYHQIFRTAEGEEKIRKGFLARIRLVNFEEGIVLPHEATLAAPKEDRLLLLRACKTNFSPIFSLYSDPDQKVEQLLHSFTRMPPRAKTTDPDGITNCFWPISDADVIAQIAQLMKDQWVLIADGHHRYESSLLYRDEMAAKIQNPDASFHFTLMYFCNINQPGITVLPYNRAVFNLPDFHPDDILKKAAEYFAIQKFQDENAAHQALKEAGNETTAFIARFSGKPGPFLLKLKQAGTLEKFHPPGTPSAVQNLDVNVLHKVFLGGILSISEEDIRDQKYLKYYKNAQDELKDFQEGRLQIAFFLNPTRVEQVVDVSKAGRKMPQKSTFFYPKLMTGFVLNKHE
jgi:uncharacterized protein (DUF1015 family)